MARLRLDFEVNDDLTSERIEEYRQAVIKALEEFVDWPEAEANAAERKLADKILGDWERPA